MILLCGEDNPQSALPEHALYNYPPGCAGWRLQKILGLDDDAYLALARTNLCSPTWNAAAAVARAAVLGGEASPYHVIVALGLKVRLAFSRALHIKLQTWSIARVGSVALLALPHPSGRCQIWNKESARAQARGLLRELAPEIRWGS